MNELLTTTRTMDSREIAELLGARHADVFESISTQLHKAGYTAVPYTYIHPQNGRKYQAYKLPFRETMIVVSGYSVELRARVIDRWMELERSAVPQGTELLALAVLEADKMLKEKDQRISVLAPKAAIADRIATADGLRELGEVGKINGIGPRKIFQLLGDRGILYRHNGTWVPYQQFVDAGYFVVREKTFDLMDRPQLYSMTYVTGKGEIWLAKQLFGAVSA